VHFASENSTDATDIVMVLKSLGIEEEEEEANEIEGSQAPREPREEPEDEATTTESSDDVTVINFTTAAPDRDAETFIAAVLRQLGEVVQQLLQPVTDLLSG